MRWSQYYLFTTREVPNDAEVISHQLMVRTGMIKKVAAGIYNYLPLGWRSLQKLMNIVRREMNAAGAIELMLPSIQPAELWQESGRWQRYGKELLRIKDRHDRDFVFGPTEEEVITDMVRRDVKSYRQLPFNLYQIQTKFRDEIRPRFGLMRGREFIMKDSYSFGTSPESLDITYESMRNAYCRVFESCKLDYSMVEADVGTIGGSVSHEFMVVADTGESAVVRCPECGYAANVEKAETRGISESAAQEGREPQPLKEVATPGQKTIEEVSKFLGIEPRQLVKTLIYETEKGFVAVLIRGDREINEVKLTNHLDVQHLNLASEDKVREATNAPVGFAGPVGLSGIRIVADETVRGMTDFATGANKEDAHYTGVNWERDADLSEFADLLLVSGGDPCPRCEGTLELFRGIEVGHIFKLGTKYSAAMGCNFTDEDGQERPMFMGCYGLGIGRTVAAAIEQNHDADGIIWPRPLAPFEVLLAALNPDDGEVRRVAEQIYGQLLEKGIEVLYDDRDERPGVKFKDADLVGFPVRVVVGAKSLADGKVEVSLRRDRQKQLVPVVEAVPRVMELLGE
ncbi:MAG TPA: proline--tRNA ligase [Thermoanaerobaculia bacterium]|nr:proline--tRNA ligase [Thermoanaerobaculia bacterium]